MKYINTFFCLGRRKIISHILPDDRGEGGYLKKVTLDDTGGVGVCGTPKKGDIIKVQPQILIEMSSFVPTAITWPFWS